MQQDRFAKAPVTFETFLLWLSDSLIFLVRSFVWVEYLSPLFKLCLHGTGIRSVFWFLRQQWVNNLLLFTDKKKYSICVMSCAMKPLINNKYIKKSICCVQTTQQSKRTFYNWVNHLMYVLSLFCWWPSCENLSTVWIW